MHRRALPGGLTVAIRPRVGHSVSEYFGYVNGNPPAGRSVYVSDDLGLAALRADAGFGDPPSAGDSGRIRRNQVVRRQDPGW